MEHFFGMAYNRNGILIWIIVFGVILLSTKILAAKREWKISKLQWIGTGILSIIVANVISSFIVI